MDLSGAFQVVFGLGVRKQLAQEAHVSAETVKVWLSGKWPRSRRTELSELLLARVKAQRARLDDIERKLLEKIL